MNFSFNLTSARTKKQVATLTVMADSKGEALDIAEEILLGDRRLLLVDVGCISHQASDPTQAINRFAEEESYTDFLLNKDNPCKQ